MQQSFTTLQLQVATPGGGPYLAVAVLHARYELLKEVASLILREAPCLNNPIKQFAPSCVLHNDSQVCVGHKHLHRLRLLRAWTRGRDTLSTANGAVRCTQSALQELLLHMTRCMSVPTCQSKPPPSKVQRTPGRATDRSDAAHSRLIPP